MDASDPDLKLPNVVHNFMSAESARRAGEPDWLQLTLLLHDLGKVMFLFGTPEDGQSGRADGPQWALGGDTWVLGEPVPDSAVFPELNALNPEHNASLAAPRNAPGVGLDALRFTFGHDEYAFRFLAHPANGCRLPKQALQMVRLHSCYPLHSSGEYQHLLRAGDEDALEWVRRFNQYDLYSKTDDVPKLRDLDRMWPYYAALMDKYFERGAEGWLSF